MLRSLVVMTLAGYTEIKAWVALMKAEPFYAVLSGFAPGNPPGVGTFYHFFNRILEGRPAPQHRPVRRLTPARKRELREAKRQPAAKHQAIVARLAAALQGEARHWQPRRAERLLNALLTELCVRPAIAQGILPETVGISGDGTKLATFANSYGKKVCACTERGCGCPRRFTDPDASTGYDSYHGRYVYGHNLYELTAWSHASKIELPVYLLRATASRSDAVLGPLALHRLRQITPLRLGDVCFDGAHDAAAFYDLAQTWGLTPFIPLAGAPPRSGGGVPTGRDTDGTPLCLAGRRMYPDGYQPDRRRQRWRCPLKKGPERGDVMTCPHRQACSTAKMGRIVYTYPGKDARLNCVPPRGSESWKAVYRHRTASERSFARKKTHLGLDRTRTRGGDRWLFRALVTAIAQHVTVWQQHQPIA